jgi:hypothetical protein
MSCRWSDWESTLKLGGHLPVVIIEIAFGGRGGRYQTNCLGSRNRSEIRLSTKLQYFAQDSLDSQGLLAIYFDRLILGSRKTTTEDRQVGKYFRSAIAKHQNILT